MHPARPREFPFPSSDGTADPTAADVVVHKRSSKNGDTFRAVLDVPLYEGDQVWYDVEVFKGLLQTPETASCCECASQISTALSNAPCAQGTTWSRAEARSMCPTSTRGSAGLVIALAGRQSEPSLESESAATALVLTSQTFLGSPRDTITISKTFCDGHSLIWVSTSLPRSSNEPPHLRPAPPYVRAHMALQAFHIQCLPTPSSLGGTDGDVTPGTSRETLRLTCFWSWDPKGAWMVGGSLPMHLPGVLLGLVRHAKRPESRIPVLAGFGTGVVLSELALEPKRTLLECRYVVVDEADDADAQVGHPSRPLGSLEGAEALALIKERRRLFHAVEFALSPTHAWDVQITAKSSSTADDPHWTTFIGRYLGPASPPRLVLRCSHAHLGSRDDVARVSVSIERTTGTFGVRVNGVAAPIEALEPRDRSALPLPMSLADTGSGLSGPSVAGRSDTTSVLNAVDDALVRGGPADLAGTINTNTLKRRRSGRVKRSAADEKQISAIIKRNYICEQKRPLPMTGFADAKDLL